MSVESLDLIQISVFHDNMLCQQLIFQKIQDKFTLNRNLCSGLIPIDVTLNMLIQKNIITNGEHNESYMSNTTLLQLL